METNIEAKELKPPLDDKDIKKSENLVFRLKLMETEMQGTKGTEQGIQDMTRPLLSLLDLDTTSFKPTPEPEVTEPSVQTSADGI